MKLTKTFVRTGTTVVDAMRIIENSGAQIGLVVDEHKRLLGTLTDGDIRRGFLQGESLDSPVDHLMNRRFRSASCEEDREELLNVMRREGIGQIPVLGAQGQVTDLLLLRELIAPTQLSNAVVIMAGGKGTRLLPLTEQYPKPMLHVDGKPMLESLLEQFIANGFHRFYISVNYLKEIIMDYFQDGSQWGVTIEYLVEDMPLGTAGGLRLLPTNMREAFIVANGDVLTRLNPRKLISFHIEHNAIGTLCVHEHTTTVPFGVVRANGVDLEAFEEKPIYRNLVNAGVYVVNPEILQMLPTQAAIDMPTLLQNAQMAGKRIVVCPIHEYWIDVGRPETLRQAHLEWPKENCL